MGERKRTEADLRRHREWLRVTLTSIGDAVIACDDQGRVTFINVIAASLTGWQPEEARGQPVANVFKIINEQTRQPAEDIVPRVLREQRVLGLANHTVLISRDGREIPVEDSAAPIMDASRTMLGVVLVFHDVIEKRRAEEILNRNREELERLVAQRTAKLQEMISELQHVSYSIVHDLRAPLRAMQGFAALLEEECAGCAKTAVVLGNQALLTQCFSNLLGNAVKFVAPDTMPQMRVRAEMLDGTARVWIENNGIGIAKDLQGRLFGMFQRLTQDYEGTGMGLAIVRKVVERMGGKVGLESEEGKGSRFWVELRAVSGDDVPVAPADEVR
jgi:PAS domain S-box-containing protein